MENNIKSKLYDLDKLDSIDLIFERYTKNNNIIEKHYKHLLTECEKYNIECNNIINVCKIKLTEIQECKIDKCNKLDEKINEYQQKIIQIKNNLDRIDEEEKEYEENTESEESEKN